MNFLPGQATILEYFNMGGFVMLPLIGVSIILWYAIALRLFNVRSSRFDARNLIRQAEQNKVGSSAITASATRFAVSLARTEKQPKILKAKINEEFANFRSNLAKHKTLVRTLVAIAPLLGLLGTVDGMIETFNSLADMALFSQSGGIAGGISKALFTTQMGLVISIPGLLLGRIIERKERDIVHELDQIRDLVCAKAR